MKLKCLIYHMPSFLNLSTIFPDNPSPPIVKSHPYVIPIINVSTIFPKTSSLIIGKSHPYFYRTNGHHSSSYNPDNLPLLVAAHSKSHQHPFNSCWNVRILLNLSPNNNHITCCHLKSAYQFILSFRHSAGIKLR